MDTRLESIYLRHVMDLLSYIASRNELDKPLEDFSTVKGMPPELREHLTSLAKERSAYWEDVQDNVKKRIASNDIPMQYSLHIREDRTFCLYDDFGTILVNSSLKTLETSDYEVINDFLQFLKSKVPTKSGDIINVSITAD